MPKQITFITNYYLPETGAAANRIALMAELFVEAGYEVHILCPLPNYPTGQIFLDYKGKNGHTEIINGVKVTRLWVYATNSANPWKRLYAMLSFSFSLWNYKLRNKLPKLIFIQYSPIIVGALSSFLWRSKKYHILLNVSDLWPLTAKELEKIKDGILYRFLQKIELYTYKKAKIIMGQSEEILSHVKTLLPEKPHFLYRNFAEFSLPTINTSLLVPEKKYLVYAGLLGVAQGVFELCKYIEIPDDCEFHIYGSGAETKAIEEYITSSGKSIYYKGSLSRKQLHEKLIHYDLALIPLLKRIYGSVPSKIFEYAKLGLPMLYFGGGEGERIVKDNGLGWVVSPRDYTSLNKQITAIITDTDYNIFDKQGIMKKSERLFDAKKQFEKLLNILD